MLHVYYINRLINSLHDAINGMRCRFAFILTLFLLFSLANIPSMDNTDYTEIPTVLTLSQGPIPIERNWTLNIVVVNYNASYIDETTLLNGLPTERVYATTYATITYNIEYAIHYASAAYANDLLQVMMDNSINGTELGTSLNESALSYQIAFPDEPQTIFYPRDGREIDGYAIEDWIEENPAVVPPQLGYTLYLVNYSSLDTSSHTLEHWYDYHPVDADTGQKQDWFRLEWDNALNPSVSMDYPFFGGRFNTFFVDPSAHQWYLKWCRLWWSAFIGTEYEFWTKDLEDKMAEINLETPAGVDALSTYLRESIWDPITQLLFPYQHQPAKYVNSGLLRALVFCMDVANGTTLESLEWVTDAEMQKVHLEELYPFISWDVQVDFLDIDQYPQWNTTFWANAVLLPDGMTVANGSTMFSAIYNTMRPQYIDVDDENINVFGVVFVKKQMVMEYFGSAYTGLGGGGQTVIWKSWERYYRPDGVTPKDGISTIQLHETMHAIGFLHSWQHEHYASDFSYSPMGYFAFHNGTATFDRNWVQGTYLDQMEAQLWDEFVTEQSALGEDEQPKTYLAEERALTCFTLARNYYNQMDWLDVYNALSQARDWTKRMKFSIIDTIPPEIEDWGVNPACCGGFEAWAVVSDNLAGLENVTVQLQIDQELPVQLYPCVFNGSHWIVNVQSTGAVHSITANILAWDWAMNSAFSSNFTWFIYTDTTPPPYPTPELYVYLSIIAGASLVLVVSIVYIKTRRVR
ncbi:MAG: hypothetical protein ACFFDV_09155 [Candidatus Thorarchaeota archaeon]